MNAEHVVKKILSEAQQQAKAIVQEAQQKTDALKHQLEQELSAYRAETDRLARAAADDKRARMQAAGRMDNARALLAAKADLLAAVFDKAQQRLAQMPDEPYRNLMMRLMTQAVETGEEEVIVGKDERRIDDAFIKQVNRQLGTGFKGNLRLSDRRADIAAGFLLARGKVQMNAGVDVLVGRLREAMEMELAAKLFG